MAVGNDATSSNPIVQDLRGFFVAHTLDSCCDPSCPGSILAWLQFADTHNLHICSTSTGSASAAAAAWDMVERSLRAYRADKDKAAVLMVLMGVQDLQPDLVEAVLVILADTLLPDAALAAFSCDALAHVSRPAYYSLSQAPCGGPYDAAAQMRASVLLHVASSAPAPHSRALCMRYAR